MTRPHLPRILPANPQEIPPDPMTNEIVIDFVRGLPGPRRETPEAKAARLERQLAEVRALGPRDLAEALFATQCVLIRMINETAQPPPGVPDNLEKRLNARLAYTNAYIRQGRRMIDLLTHYPSRRGRPPAPAAHQPPAPPRQPVPFPVPREHPTAGDEPMGGVIVPLHRAPSTLQ